MPMSRLITPSDYLPEKKPGRGVTTLLWVLIIMGVLAGTLSATRSFFNANALDKVNENGLVSACIGGRLADVMNEVGRSVISAEDFQANPDLSTAFRDLEAAVELVDTEIACEELERERSS